MAGPRNKAVLGLSLLVLLTACGKEGPKEPLAPRVYVQQVSTREFAPPIQLSGDIQARVETQLSFRVGGKIIERKVPAESLGGPILIAQMAQQEARQGILRLFYFIAIISVNLAVLNLLPIPVLDGGHILFYIIESIIRRPINVRVREAAQQVGILLLIMLMIFVFYNDITRTWFK